MLVDWGYLILAATLVQAVGLSLVLILLPLWLGRGRARPAPARWRVFGYFLAIGLAFLFVEIASIQRFLLFLSQPLYAVAVVLGAFLVFAGLGSGAVPRLAERLSALGGTDGSRMYRLLARRDALEIAVAAIAILALLYVMLLPPLFPALMGLGDPLKVALSLLLITPLAFWMGMPFPLALARVADAMPELVPWAWGINGCASVLSAVLAVLLAINLGFTAVVAIAVGLYLLAALLLRRPLAHDAEKLLNLPGQIAAFLGEDDLLLCQVGLARARQDDLAGSVAQAHGRAEVAAFGGQSAARW